MNEFSLINAFFKASALARTDVLLGIGDDAACIEIPPNQHLLVSTDSFVAQVHFLSSWDAYDIAWKAAMATISDMAAMGAMPCWMSLALTMPDYSENWLTRFSEGLQAALRTWNVALIGGDTTCGPLSLTLTVQGLAPKDKAVRRNGAKPGDQIWVTGELGAAALAVLWLGQPVGDIADQAVLMNKLQHPVARVDFNAIVQQYASAAIDISDGLSADLGHICEESQAGACLRGDAIPVHPLVKKYQPAMKALDLALSGGDDYELCFTIPPFREIAFKKALQLAQLNCYPIGIIEQTPGLRLQNNAGEITALPPKGYCHFQDKR